MALSDRAYVSSSFQLSEREHRYGSQIHLLDDPFLFTAMAKLGRPECKQPVINQLLGFLYSEMVKIAVNKEFPLQEVDVLTRMHAFHKEGKFRALIVDPDTRVVCVNLARAGTVPSHICYDFFNYVLNPDGVRQDHFAINRKTDADEKVVGTNLAGHKIGGDIDGSFVVIPDPMGATGSTIKTALEIYRQRGKAKKYLALHLVVTPEYLRTVTKACPELSVYAIRLDRGLSAPDVLETVPGTHWDKERGLNDKQYIVPGAGGLGEVINNSYV